MKKISDIITTHDLTKYYSRFPGVLDLNLSVKQGEVFGFLGPNGAGKTTTIRLLLGLLKPSAGKIMIFGKEAEKIKEDQLNRIGYLPGDLGLYKDMSGGEYLRHFMRLRRGKCNDKHLYKMKELMSKFDIAFEKKIAAYSKGMRQVIGIIQAFMHDPQLLILDEPTSGLDPIMQEIFYEELLMEEKKAGKTVFFSSHILSEVEKICDRAGIVKNGKLIKVEEIGKYCSSVIKKVSIIPQGEMLQSSRMLKRLTGVKNTVIKNGKIEFLYSGDMQSLVQCISDIKIKDLVCESPALEDVFYQYYKG